MKKKYDIKRYYNIQFSERDNHDSSILDRLIGISETLDSGEHIILDIDWKYKDKVNINILTNATLSIDDIEYSLSDKCGIEENISATHFEMEDENVFVLIHKEKDEFNNKKEEKSGKFSSLIIDDDNDEHAYKYRHDSSAVGIMKTESMKVRYIIEAKENGKLNAQAYITMPQGLTRCMKAAMKDSFPRVEMIDYKSANLNADNYLDMNEESVVRGLIRAIIIAARNTQIEELEKDETGIEILELSVRSYNVLKRASIDTIEQLQRKSDEELQQIRNLGVRQFNEIKEKLEKAIEFQKEENESNDIDYSAELEKLIGLGDVKEQVKRIVAFAKLKKDMLDSNNGTLPISLNMIFKGNPGTAKTTVARLLAGIFHKIGILPSEGIVEVGRADLVGQYTGQTAPKVQSAFDRAKGKVLFIDEAYSLVDYYRNGYGDEAISTIIQEMENRRDETIVIFAGYPYEMDKFISTNPGLKSRVPFELNFNDYTTDELMQIAEIEAEKKGFSIDEEAKDKIQNLCGLAKRDGEFGNGRFCRNLVEDAILSYANRVYNDDVDVCFKDLKLVESDFKLPKQVEEKVFETRKRIGFI